MDITNRFSNNLNYYLDLNNKTRSELADDLGIARTVISSWCNGINFPRADKIMMLSKYFNVNFVDFFLDKSSGNDLNEIINIIQQLDDEYKNIVVAQAKTLLDLQKSK